jgi:hypothetical protein
MSTDLWVLAPRHREVWAYLNRHLVISVGRCTSAQMSRRSRRPTVGGLARYARATSCDCDAKTGWSSSAGSSDHSLDPMDRGAAVRTAAYGSVASPARAGAGAVDCDPPFVTELVENESDRCDAYAG